MVFTFKIDQSSVEDFECSDRPSPSDENVEKVHQVIHEDRWCTINDVHNILRLSYDTDRCILTEDLNMWRTAAKFVPRLLNYDLK
jgi:hypothetical protein